MGHINAYALFLMHNEVFVKGIHDITWACLKMHTHQCMFLWELEVVTENKIPLKYSSHSTATVDN